MGGKPVGKRSWQKVGPGEARRAELTDPVKRLRSLDPTAAHAETGAGGPRQPLALLQDEDRSRDVIRRALDLVRGQSQELRSAVRVLQRQLGAAGVIPVGAASHHASHKIGHGRFHPREHDGPPAAAAAARRRAGSRRCDCASLSPPPPLHELTRTGDAVSRR
ncbi:hypothetical protein EYF80_022334 [Liparis tanakae]|uniref:Uncharacterized protein n=1 Tax=Liparis tanakae TaxID=230148 RepID=A0A4Z2HNH6_9TELE|nr:hypothetical protein EYF80_022334 [Liparis tanakae]